MEYYIVQVFLQQYTIDEGDSKSQLDSYVSFLSESFDILEKVIAMSNPKDGKNKSGFYYIDNLLKEIGELKNIDKAPYYPSYVAFLHESSEKDKSKKATKKKDLEKFQSGARKKIVEAFKKHPDYDKLFKDGLFKELLPALIQNSSDSEISNKEEALKVVDVKRVADYGDVVKRAVERCREIILES